MLSMFVVKRTFNKLDAKIYVDCEKKEATFTTKYDRILKLSHEPINYNDVDSPQKAEAFFGKLMPATGGEQALIEWLEAKYRAEAYAAG